jgi:hypothetical protein
MPRYYFVVTNRNGRVVDSTGLLLPSDTLARSEAVAALRLIQAEDPGADWDSWAVEIFDDGEPARATLSDGPQSGRYTGHLGHGVPRLERFAAIGLPRTANALTIRVTRAAPSRTRLGLLHAGYKRSRRVREPIQFVLASRG